MLPVVDRSMFNVQPVDWLGLHREYLQPGEMEIIVAILREAQARCMAEFGVRDGRTARVLLANVPTLVSYIGVDVLPGYVPTLEHQRQEMVADPGWYAIGDPRFLPIIRERGTLDLDPADIGPADAIFIDGDHGECAVMSDSRLARATIAANGGGVIIWHDYNNVAVGVTRTLDRLASEGWPIKAIDGTWLAFLHEGKA